MHALFILAISLLAMHGWHVGPISVELLNWQHDGSEQYVHIISREKSLCFSWFYEYHKMLANSYYDWIQIVCVKHGSFHDSDG